MSREIKYTAVILKKQPFNEGDEIVTVFTKEQGKLRCLAKSVKKPLSKLQQKLQALFLVELRLTSASKFPKIIGAEPIKVFSAMRENLAAMKMAFYATELVLKFTADENPNQALFALLESFLSFLDSTASQTALDSGLAKFKIEILEAMGLGISYPGFSETTDKVFFSADRGGFVAVSNAGGLPVGTRTVKAFMGLKQADFGALTHASDLPDLEELQNLLSKFIEYQLERKIKSEKFLTGDNMV